MARQNRKPLIEPGSALPESAGQGDDLQARIIARDRERNGRAAPEHETAGISDSYITDNITNHITDQSDSYMTSNTVSNTPDPTASKPDRQIDAQQDGQAVSQADFLSVAQSIRQAASQRTERPIYKPVTLKLRTDMDERIEKHCRDTGRLKQDVVHDALTLYFSVVEGEG